MAKVKFFKKITNLALLRALTYGVISFLILTALSLIGSPTLSTIAQPTISPTASPGIEQPAASPTASPGIEQPESPGSAQPAPENQPRTCRVGAYLIGLYGFELAEKSFGADMWLWSTCPSADLEPLKVMSIVNGQDVTTSLYATYKRQKGYWSYIKVSGTFRYRWDVRNFPFDRHVLPIRIENTNAASTDFIYTPDTQGSKNRQGLNIEGWEINNLTIEEKSFEYDTNFGDPDLEGTQKSSYSRLNILIHLSRKSPVTFFKLTAPVYISFAISLLAYLLDTASGLGLLAGALFAVVVNQQSAESVLGRVEGLTLIDKIHINAMAYILANAIVIVYSHLKSETGKDKPEFRLRRHQLSFLVALISYVIINIILVMAAKAG